VLALAHPRQAAISVHFTLKPTNYGGRGRARLYKRLDSICRCTFVEGRRQPVTSVSSVVVADRPPSILFASIELDGR
jgi:hypothetical protein